MSVKIIGTRIKMTRGDTFERKVDIFLDKEHKQQYIPVEGDYIRFAMKKKYTDEAPIILKEIPIDTCLLHLEPNDTKELAQPSEYVYDIEITMNNGFVDTFIEGKLYITEEVF